MAGAFPPTVVIDQATDFYLTVIYKDPAGSPINLTGYTARFALAQYNQPASLVLTNGSGITLDSSGNINIHATEIQTNLPEGTYDAELNVTSPGGNTTALLKGHIRLIEQVA